MKLLLGILLATGINISLFASTIEVKEKQIFENNIENKTEVITEVDEEELFKKESSIEIKALLKKKNPSRLSRKLTRKYYKYHNYEPFFVNKDGIKPLADELITTIKNDQVLKPNINKLFKLQKIEDLVNLAKETQKIEDLINADFILVSTYHKYTTFLSKGIINWKAFQTKLKSLDEKSEIIANWRKYSVKKNKRTLLYEAIKNDDITLAINEVNYTFPKANELAQKISELEEIAQNGGYTKIPLRKKSMKKGNYYPEIKLLRERLIQSHDLKEATCFTEEIKEQNNDNNLFKAEPQVETINIDKDTATVKVTKPELIKDCKELFDQNVFEAVKSFQKNHGLVEDGIVGRNTIKRLNISAEKRIKQIRINLERMRWMPRNLGEKYLLVNIPDYKLKMYDNGEKKLDMAVVVGEKRHPTPIFSHQVSSVVLNPYWRIPQRIVRREIIPKLVEDPSYLDRNEIKAFENWSHKSTEYDVSAVDWSMYMDNDLIGNTQSAPMRFIQIPGQKNPLGRMKFLFPNKYSVYLHDTPHKRLFKIRKRAFSHGCIRLSRPHDLLKTIADAEEKMDYEETKEILSDIEKTDYYLKKKLPVHIIYLTAWIDDEGKMQFRDDVYNYDRMHGKLLYKKPL